jgi:hypothetical protein
MTNETNHQSEQTQTHRNFHTGHQGTLEILFPGVAAPDDPQWSSEVFYLKADEQHEATRLSDRLQAPRALVSAGDEDVPKQTYSIC